MADATRRPRVAVLGARENELELLAELHRHDRVELIAVYDPDPHATGLALAEIAGVPSGSDAVIRERFAHAEFVVLPSNRIAFSEAIDWCSGLHGELINVTEARKRWGGARVEPGALPDAHTRVQELDAAGARLGSIDELGEWFLDTAMRAVGASGGSLQLLAPETSELYLLAARGLAEQVVRDSRHPVGEPISGLTAAMRAPQVLHGERAGRAPTQRGPVSSALSVPLVTDDGTLVGVLNVSSTVEGRRFEERDAERLRQLGPGVAHLLRRARRFESSAHRLADVQIVETLRELEERGGDATSTLQALAENLRSVFDADAVVLYLSTPEGDWLHLASAERHGETSRAATSRSAAARAFAEQRWLHIVETPAADAPEAPPTDAISAIVERAFEPVPDIGPAHSCVYAPLIGTRPVGVLAARFRRLSAAQRFLQHGEPTLRNVALYVETRVREQELHARLARAARLAQLAPALLEAHQHDQLDAVLVREAALLVSAERAILRHVDEERRTYSRPRMHGIPEASVEGWRTLDARVTEETLQRREWRATTTLHAQGDRLEEPVHYRSFASLPITLHERLLAILNVYDKRPDPLLGARTFSDFDRELLEGLGATMARLLPEAHPGARLSSTTHGSELGPESGNARESQHSAREPTSRAPYDPLGQSPALPGARMQEAAPAARAPEVLPGARIPERPAEDGTPLRTQGASAATFTAPFVPPSAAPRPGGPGELDSVRLREELKREIARAQRHQRELGVSLLHVKGLRETEEAEQRRLLDVISQVVREYVRASDLVGWYGPDRLMIVSPESDARADELEFRLRELLRETLPQAGPSGRVDIRVGSSRYPDDGEDASTLLQTAAARLH